MTMNESICSINASAFLHMKLQSTIGEVLPLGVSSDEFMIINVMSLKLSGI